MRKVPLPHWASNPFWSSLQSSKLSIWGSKREVTGEQYVKGDPVLLANFRASLQSL